MKELHIYNTLSRKKEKFDPIDEDLVTIYVCGPTVYGEPHLGHAKSYVSFDLVVRYIRYLGYRVRYVQNITDVGHLTDDADEGEDKLQKQARKERLEPMEIAEKYTYDYFKDMDALNVKRPDISPRASGHIPEQIEMIEKIIENGNAYVANGNVYFDVTSDPDYGKLSGRQLEEQQSGVRVETASDKKNSADFALWKKAEPGHIMRWRSPWSVGYPGWHIECSAMSTRYLGQHFDIHGGGIENQFPHHECEIAQSEAANNQPFAKYWMHNNMVTLNGQKMGKSLGNAITLEQFFNGDHELLSRAWDPMIIRFSLLQSHYRSPSDFSEEALASAENGLRNLQDMVRLIGNTQAGSDDQYDLTTFKDDIEGHLNDDFNSPAALASLFEHLRDLRHQIHQGSRPSNLEEIKSFIKGIVDDVLALWPSEEEQGQIGGVQITNELIELLIEIRTEARKNKNFELADTIRDRLKELGVELLDTKQGTTYEIKIR